MIEYTNLKHIQFILSDVKKFFKKKVYPFHYFGSEINTKVFNVENK